MTDLSENLKVLAQEVKDLTDIRAAVSAAFAGQQQIIGDLQAKVAAIQTGTDAPSIDELAADIAQLHELNAQLRSGIPANTSE